MKRRDFLSSSATTALGLAFAPTLARAAEQKAAMPAAGSLEGSRAFTTEFKPKALPFNPKKLNGLSEKLVQSHWENNYMGSVKALNGVKKKLAEVAANKETPPFLYNGLKREHLMRTGSVVYHDMYFGNLGGSGKASGQIQKEISAEFGSFNNWETEFRRVGAGLGGGSGWVVLGYNTHVGLVENYWSPDHMHAPIGTIPLLVMDMFEHSYQMDFGAAAAKYIDAFFLNINWDEVGARFEHAKKIKMT